MWPLGTRFRGDYGVMLDLMTLKVSSNLDNSVLAAHVYFGTPVMENILK